MFFKAFLLLLAIHNVQVDALTCYSCVFHAAQSGSDRGGECVTPNENTVTVTNCSYCFSDVGVKDPLFIYRGCETEEGEKTNPYHEQCVPNKNMGMDNDNVTECACREDKCMPEGKRFNNNNREVRLTDKILPFMHTPSVVFRGQITENGRPVKALLSLEVLFKLNGALVPLSLVQVKSVPNYEVQLNGLVLRNENITNTAILRAQALSINGGSSQIQLRLRDGKMLYEQNIELNQRHLLDEDYDNVDALERLKHRVGSQRVRHSHHNVQNHHHQHENEQNVHKRLLFRQRVPVYTPVDPQHRVPVYTPVDPQQQQRVPVYTPVGRVNSHQVHYHGVRRPPIVHQEPVVSRNEESSEYIY